MGPAVPYLTLGTVIAVARREQGVAYVVVEL
jgi:hypothetical protein